MSKKNPELKVVTKATKETKTPAPVKEGVRVAVIAREMGMNPKGVRARLRRIYANPGDRKLPQPLAAGSWTFAEKDRAAVEKLIASVKTEATES